MSTEMEELSQPTLDEFRNKVVARLVLVRGFRQDEAEALVSYYSEYIEEAFGEIVPVRDTVATMIAYMDQNDL